MYLPLKLRIQLARGQATRIQSGSEATVEDAGVSAAAIVDQLNPDMVVDHSDRIIVTEVGFVTMALLPRAARYCGGLLVIPGVDDRAQRGHLVLRKGFVPYHSIAADIEKAAVEAQDAHARAAKLVEFFGGRQALKQAALSAPWYLLSQPADVDAAGLCQWGSASFLRRFGMFRIGMSFGLPRIVLRLAGSYGNRITAATLLRQSSASENSASRNTAPGILGSRLQPPC